MRGSKRKGERSPLYIRMMALTAVCLMVFAGCAPSSRPKPDFAESTASTAISTQTSNEITRCTSGEPVSPDITTQVSIKTTLRTTDTHRKGTIFTQQTTKTTTAAKTGTATTTILPQLIIRDPQGNQSFSNLTHNNAGGKMGDCDGPAFCVYSKKGYNCASMDIVLSDLQMNVSRQSDQRLLTAYIFLGADSYDDNGSFVNCFDAGLGYDIVKQKWVLFYNILYVQPIQQKWYMSSKPLDETHDFRLVLDTSQEDGWATMILYDLTAGGIEYDRASFRTFHTCKDGHNTVYYQDYALDFPDNVKYDTSGQPVDSNWPEITLYNTDQSIYMKNLKILNITINNQPWTADKTANRAVWPDCTMAWMDYPVLTVSHGNFDSEWLIDIDMNRK